MRVADASIAPANDLVWERVRGGEKEREGGKEREREKERESERDTHRERGVGFRGLGGL